MQVLLGDGTRSFLRELMEQSGKEKEYVIHFVTMREMVNIALAACEGKCGNPGDYRDFRLKLIGR
jgi:hypothetical protein